MNHEPRGFGPFVYTLAFCGALFSFVIFNPAVGPLYNSMAGALVSLICYVSWLRPRRPQDQEGEEWKDV